MHRDDPWHASHAADERRQIVKSPGHANLHGRLDVQGQGVTVMFGLYPQTTGDEQPVEVGTDDQADGNPAFRNDATSTRLDGPTVVVSIRPGARRLDNEYGARGY